MPTVEVDATDRIPTPSQWAFQQSRARVSAFLGGYGSGKTSTGAEMALDLAAENAGCDGMIVAPTWGTLHRVTLRAFYDPEAPDSGACPRQIIAAHNAGKRYFELVYRSRVYYGSADRPGSLEGPNLAWWWLDEARLVRSAAWRILIARLREARAKRLQAIVTSTPAAGWLQEEFGEGKQDREVIHGSTRENAHNLAPGFIEDLERTYTARQCRVLIDGEFGLFDGAVLEEFDPKYHCIEWTYNPNLRTILVIDFGYRMPYAAWFQLVPQGTMLPNGLRALDNTAVLFDEFAEDNTTTEVLAMKARARGHRVDMVYCDPAGDGTQIATGLSDVGVLKQYGFPEVRFQTDPRFRHIPTGIRLLQGQILNAQGQTRFWVSKALNDPRKRRGFVKAALGYRYPEAKDNKPVGDMPLKDGLHDHQIDVARYFVINEMVSRGFMARELGRM